MRDESGLLIGSQQVSFFELTCFFQLFPNLPHYSFIDKTGFLIGYKNPNWPASVVAYAAVRLKLLNNNGEQNLADY